MNKVSLLAASVAIALAGCGGSDGGSKPVQTGKIAITAMDGYIQNALLCADENKDGQCQVEEVIKGLNGEPLMTDATGKINADISLADQTRLNEFARLIVTIQSVFPDTTIQTVDSDNTSVAMKDVTLRAPAGSNIINPITDLVVAKMIPASDADSGLSKEDAEKAVLESLGGLTSDEELPTDILYSDYIEAKESTDNTSAELAAKIHKTAQILTETKANATSDKAFDKVVEDVVSSTVTEVKDLTTENLNDPTFKPYVPVDEEGTAEIITNILAKFDATQMKALEAKLDAVEGHFGDVDLWQDISVTFDMTKLVVDKEASSQNIKNNISVANENSLSSKNLKVTITEAGLTITRIDATKAVMEGDYDIILATTDINSNGVAMEGTVKAADELEFNIESFNNAPEVNDDSETAKNIQAQLNRLELEKDVAMAQVTIAFDDLFSDEDGDTLNYSAEVTLPGLTAEVSGTNVILSGTPKASLEDAVLTIMAVEVDTEDKLTASIDFTLPKATVTHPSELKDILVNSNEPWYRWIGEDEYNYDTNTLTGAQNCMGFKFVQGDSANEGTVLFAEGETCPASEQITEQDGTWSVGENGEVVWSFGDTSQEGDDEAIILSGLIDHTNDEYQPRIVTFELETKATLAHNDENQRVMKVENTGRGVNFYQGIDSAEHYWNYNEGYAWIANKEIKVDLTAVHGQFTQYEKNEHIDVDMYFNDLSCEDLGFKKDPNNSQNNGYMIDDLRAEHFNLYSQGLNGKAIQFSAKNSDKPYAFGGEDSDGTPYCGVNLDISNYMAEHLGATTKAGQSLTIHYSPKDSNTDEEFIVNTFIDRDVEIEPKANLVIDEQGVYFVDGLSVSRVFKDEDGELREMGMNYTGSWGDWYSYQGQTITQYTALNGHFAYQFWNESEHDNDDESFTIWSDVNGEMMFKDAGDSDAASMGAYFLTLEDAQAEVEANAKPMVFTGTSWVSSNQDTMSFTADKVTYNNETMLRTELPGDYPSCMIDEEANTCLVGTAIAAHFCDDGSDSGSWENCAEEDRYTVGWHFEKINEIKRVKFSDLYGQVSEEIWTRQ